MADLQIPNLNKIKEQIEISGGRKKLENLTLLFKPNLTFLGKLLKTVALFILTFDDSFN